MQRAPLPKISLYCTKAGADKEYHAQIKEKSGGYIVETRFGKRGAAKIPKALPAVLTFDEAVAEFESIVKEKKSPKKGYTESESGNAYADTEYAGKMSGNLPHLLIRILENQLEAFINDDRYGFQEKIDGERLMTERLGNAVTTSNKLGVINSVPLSIVADALKIESQAFVLDGENLNGKQFVFDIVQLDGKCLKQLPYRERYQIYQELEMPGGFVKVPMATGASDKRNLLSEVIANHREGIVIKLLDAPYVEGKANPKAATQFKYKLMDPASCIVIKRHKTKSSVELGLLGADGGLIVVGNVTIPPNACMPSEGDIIDVAFMYMYQGGSLFQPQYVKPRSDVCRDECTLSQVTRIKLNVSQHEEDDD